MHRRLKSFSILVSGVWVPARSAHGQQVVQSNVGVLFFFPSVFPGALVERRAAGNPGGTVVFVSNSFWVVSRAKLQLKGGLSLQVGRLGGFCVVPVKLQ